MGQEIPLTSKISQIELVTLAVYLLGGATDAIDTEDVAVKANELAPGRFAWRKYPEQINLELIRVYLSAAKSRGNYVSGSGRTGWTLTPGGLTWAESAAASSLNGDMTRRREERQAGSIDESRWRRERARLTRTTAWSKWITKSGESITAREAAEVFRIDSYAIGRTRDLKVARLHEMFRDDPDVSDFIAAASAIIVERKVDTE
jgi:hypothetical protein